MAFQRQRPSHVCVMALLLKAFSLPPQAGGFPCFYAVAEGVMSLMGPVAFVAWSLSLVGVVAHGVMSLCRAGGTEGHGRAAGGGGGVARAAAARRRGGAVLLPPLQTDGRVGREGQRHRWRRRGGESFLVWLCEVPLGRSTMWYECSIWQGG